MFSRYHPGSVRQVSEMLRLTLHWSLSRANPAPASSEEYSVHRDGSEASSARRKTGLHHPPALWISAVTLTTPLRRLFLFALNYRHKNCASQGWAENLVWRSHGQPQGDCPCDSPVAQVISLPAPLSTGRNRPGRYPSSYRGPDSTLGAGFQPDHTIRYSFRRQS